MLVDLDSKELQLLVWLTGPMDGDNPDRVLQAELCLKFNAAFHAALQTEPILGRWFCHRCHQESFVRKDEDNPSCGSCGEPMELDDTWSRVT